LFNRTKERLSRDPEDRCVLRCVPARLTSGDPSDGQLNFRRQTGQAKMSRLFIDK